MRLTFANLIFNVGYEWSLEMQWSFKSTWLSLSANLSSLKFILYTVSLFTRHSCPASENTVTLVSHHSSFECWVNSHTVHIYYFRNVKTNSDISHQKSSIFWPFPLLCYAHMVSKLDYSWSYCKLAAVINYAKT